MSPSLESIIDKAEEGLAESRAISEASDKLKPVPQASDQKTAALYEHCVNAYDLLSHDEATSVETDNVTGIEYLVFRGSLTNYIPEQLGLSQPYYSFIKNKLEAMGCLELARRGGGKGNKSEWLLLQEPTLELWEKAKEESKVGNYGRRLRTPRETIMQQQIDNLTRRVDALDKNMASIIEGLRKM